MTSELDTRDRDQEDSSIKFDPSLQAAYYQSLFWAVMFGAGESSFSLFASQVHAPSYYYGLLAAVPSFIGPLAQVVSANILEKFHDRKKLVMISCFIQGLCFLPLLIVCLGFYLGYVQNSGLSYHISLFAFLLAITIYYITGHMATPPWSSMMSDIVPSDKRGKFFAKLGRAPNLVALIAQLSVGVGLFLAGATNLALIVFCICFVASFISRMISVKIIASMSVPPYEKADNSYFSFWQFIKRGRESNFLMFVVFVSILHLGVNISGPYYLIYWVETLGYTKWQWVILSASGTVVSVFTLLAWGRFADSFGNKNVLKLSSLIISFLPFLWMMTTNMYWLIGFQMLGAVFWTGFNLSAFNYILEAATPSKRARCVAYFNIILGIGVLVGAFIGNEIYVHIPLNILNISLQNTFLWVLFFSGVVRLGSCLFFLPMFKELSNVSPFSLKKFFVQVVHIRGNYGIKFHLHKKSSKESEKK